MKVAWFDLEVIFYSKDLSMRLKDRGNDVALRVEYD